MRTRINRLTSASGSPGLALPKPEPRRRAKARADREEQAVERQVRAACVDRDGYCRLQRHGQPLGACDGPSEWAHWRTRAQTRGMAPERRHGTAWTLMLCRCHHYALDKGSGARRLAVEALSPDGADGPLQFTMGATVYREDA